MDALAIDGLRQRIAQRCRDSSVAVTAFGLVVNGANLCLQSASLGTLDRLALVVKVLSAIPAICGKRRFKVTTDTRHNLPIAPTLLNREFTVRKPDRVWLGDITYIATDQGWLFLAVVTDLFSHQVVGWSLREDMTREIVIDALRMAWFKRHSGKEAGLTFHSDGGSQYASCDFKNVLHEYDITSSMSRKENCWATVRSVNACSETLFGSLKVERQHAKRFKTQREAKDETIDSLL